MYHLIGGFVTFFKKCFFICILFELFLPLFAIPGIKEYLPTDNGQYIYYRDYSFNYEAYIGFLQYDTHTYAIRYVAKEPTQGLPIIELIFTVNPNNDKIELTGEKIVQQVTNDDTEVMNYMHDILYELVARRKNENNHDFTTCFTNTEDYPQFGGMVTLKFNPVFPLFNIESITAEDGTILLQSVVIGQITDKTEKGWNTFSGITTDISEQTPFFDLKNLLDMSNNETIDKDYKNLNAQWKQVMDNFFLMGNDALMFVTDVKTSERLSLLRRFSLSSADNTIFLQDQYTKISDNGTIILSNVLKATNSDIYQIDIKILSAIAKDTCTITGITVYKPYYDKNIKYFNSLIKENIQK
jgi:hypothetical protein